MKIVNLEFLIASHLNPVESTHGFGWRGRGYFLEDGEIWWWGLNIRKHGKLQIWIKVERTFGVGLEYVCICICLKCVRGHLGTIINIYEVDFRTNFLTIIYPRSTSLNIKNSPMMGWGDKSKKSNVKKMAKIYSLFNTSNVKKSNS